MESDLIMPNTLLIIIPITITVSRPNLCGKWEVDSFEIAELIAFISVLTCLTTSQSMAKIKIDRYYWLCQPELVYSCLNSGCWTKIQMHQRHMYIYAQNLRTNMFSSDLLLKSCDCAVTTLCLSISLPQFEDFSHLMCRRIRSSRFFVKNQTCLRCTDYCSSHYCEEEHSEHSFRTFHSSMGLCSAAMAGHTQFDDYLYQHHIRALCIWTKMK